MQSSSSFSDILLRRLSVDDTHAKICEYILLKCHGNPQQWLYLWTVITSDLTKIIKDTGINLPQNLVRSVADDSFLNSIWKTKTSGDEKVSMVKHFFGVLTYSLREVSLKDNQIKYIPYIKLSLFVSC